MEIMEITEEKIRDRAYQIWEREGRPDGREKIHWHVAKEELVREANLPYEPAAAAGAPAGRRPAKLKSAPLGPTRRRGSSKRGPHETTH